MTQKEMITAFCRMGITDNMFWLGSDEKADNVEAIRLTILSIYEGTKFKEDVAVNELLLLGL